MKFHIKSILASLVLFLILSGAAFADETVVAAINDIEYTTIESALNAATTGDIIQLKADVILTDSYTVSSRNFSIDGTKDEAGNYSFTIPATATLIVNNGAELDFANMILDGGTDDASDPAVLATVPMLSASGDAMIALNQVTFRNRTVIGDSENSYANNGVLAQVNGSELRMTDCTLSSMQNNNYNTAAMFYTADDSTLVITRCDFIENKLSAAPLIRASETDIEIVRSTFIDNEAGLIVSVSGTDDTVPVLSSLSIEESEFTGNSGGVIRGNYTIIEVTDSIIIGNKGETGTGIYAGSGSSLTVTDTLIHSNTATIAANDVYVDEEVTKLTLPSVAAMDIDVQDTRFSMDGWYSDKNGARWSVDGAYLYNSAPEVANTWLADSFSEASIPSGGYALRAAYTAYDTVRLIKDWDDYENLYKTRPIEVIATLKNGEEAASLFLLDSIVTDAPSAMASLSSGSEWKATISPLLQNSYNSSPYTLSETYADGSGIDTYKLEYEWEFKGDSWTDSSGNSKIGPTGIYTAKLTNTYIVPITISKVWNDANDKDEVRPEKLSAEIDMGSSTNHISVYENKDLSGDPAIAIMLSPDNDWTKTVYVTANKIDADGLLAFEGKADGYSQTGKEISFYSDGTVHVQFVNTHTLNDAAQNTISNENMVEIHYRAEKAWIWAEGADEAGQIPRPEITVILKADDVEVDRGVIPANAARARYTFFNIPKYRDNNGDVLIKYTIEEEISDPAWVKVGSAWYSIDGRGIFTPSIINVDTTTYDADPLETVHGSITNSYELVRSEVNVLIKKVWKDHNDENEIRPTSITLGLFTPDGSNLVDVISLTASTSWEGEMALPLYDINGDEIDYSEYVLKESTDYDGSNPDTATWTVNHGTYEVNSHSFTYSYSVQKITPTTEPESSSVTP